MQNFYIRKRQIDLIINLFLLLWSIKHQASLLTAVSCVPFTHTHSHFSHIFSMQDQVVSLNLPKKHLETINTKIIQIKSSNIHLPLSEINHLMNCITLPWFLDRELSSHSRSTTHKNEFTVSINKGGKGSRH